MANMIRITQAPILSKVIVEVRFRPNLGYFSDAFKIASAFEPDFEDWQTSHDPYQAILYSKSSRELLRIGSDSVAIILESDDYNRVKMLMNKVVQLLFMPSELKEVRRIGIRQIQVLDTRAEFKLLVEKMVTSFENHYDKHQELSLDAIVDYAFVLDGVKNGFKNHVRFGPVKPEEAIGRFNSSFVAPKLQHNGVFVDIDVFNDELGSDGLSSDSIEALLAESQRITSGYIKFIVEEIKHD